MAVGIIDGDNSGCYEDGDNHTRCAVLYDTVSGWAFGPMFENVDAANAFLDYLRDHNLGDPRRMEDPELRNHYGEWLKIKDVEGVMEE